MDWKKVELPGVTDVLYSKAEGIAKVSINRPEMRNAFRPKTGDDILDAFMDAWHDDNVGVVVFTGEGSAFCSGGDVSVRDPETGRYKGVKWNGASGLTHWVIRNIPKPVVAMVNGFAIGGGHVFHTLCDLTVGSDKAVFGQVGPKFGSFDCSFGICYLARLVGEKKAREIWFLCRRYSAQQALDMGLINFMVPHDKLEEETVKVCKEILGMSPTALKILKYAANSESDHLYGIERLEFSMLRMYYFMDEAREGGKAFLE
ncbi:MAG: enoyl-CoA hydratase-related protein [Chloroflexota bacterium]